MNGPTRAGAEAAHTPIGVEAGAKQFSWLIGTADPTNPGRGSDSRVDGSGNHPTPGLRIWVWKSENIHLERGLCHLL